MKVLYTLYIEFYMDFFFHLKIIELVLKHLNFFFQNLLTSGPVYDPMIVFALNVER